VASVLGIITIFACIFFYFLSKGEVNLQLNANELFGSFLVILVCCHYGEEVECWSPCKKIERSF